MQDDRQAVGAGALHQPRHVAPVDRRAARGRVCAPATTTSPTKSSALLSPRIVERLAADLVEDADPRRRRLAGSGAAGARRRARASPARRPARRRSRPRPRRGDARCAARGGAPSPRRRDASTAGEVELHPRGRRARSDARTRCHEAKHCRKRSSPAKRSAALPPARSTRSTRYPGPSAVGGTSHHALAAVAGELRRQPGVAQQRLGARLAAAEGAEHLQRMAAAAERQHRVAEAAAGRGDRRGVVEPGLLEGREGVGGQHLGPLVAVVAGRVAAREDVA